MAIKDRQINITTIDRQLHICGGNIKRQIDTKLTGAGIRSAVIE